MRKKRQFNLHIACPICGSDMGVIPYYKKVLVRKYISLICKCNNCAVKSKIKKVLRLIFAH